MTITYTNPCRDQLAFRPYFAKWGKQKDTRPKY
jgi:hypothetical protein